MVERTSGRILERDRDDILLAVATGQRRHPRLRTGHVERLRVRGRIDVGARALRHTEQQNDLVANPCCGGVQDSLHLESALGRRDVTRLQEWAAAHPPG
jgi:hypothetical protein